MSGKKWNASKWLVWVTLAEMRNIKHVFFLLFIQSEDFIYMMIFTIQNSRSSCFNKWFKKPTDLNAHHFFGFISYLFMRKEYICTHIFAYNTVQNLTIFLITKQLRSNNEPIKFKTGKMKCNEHWFVNVILFFLSFVHK